MPTAQPTRKSWSCLAISAVAVVLTGCAPAIIDPTPGERVVSRPSIDSVSFSVVGDSISAWDEPNETSWVAAVDARRVSFAGGWAVPGATTADMLAGVAEVPSADVLVIMAGTNDFLPEFPDWTLTASLSRIESIAEAVGSDIVVLSAIAPNDPRHAETDAFNQALEALAGRQGWKWVDPWPTARASDGKFLPGLSDDGIHPTAAAEIEVGADVRAAIVLAGLRSR